jgi:hypothetical protein
MSNFLLAYTGGSMAETPEAQAQTMAAWGAWFESLGDSVVDWGAPFAASSTIAADGSTSDGGSSKLTGYSVVSAESLDDAVAKVKGCPILASGGSIEVYEAAAM